MATERRPAGEKERIAARRNAVLRLRIEGHSYRAIADAYNKTVVDAGHKISAATVGEDLKAVLRELADQNNLLTVEYRELLAARNDMAYRAIAEKIKAGDLGAVDRLLKLNDQQARLFGTYAPTKIAATDPTGETAASLNDEERIARLERLLTLAEQRRHEAEGTDEPDAGDPAETE